MLVTNAEQTLLVFLEDEGQEPGGLEPSRTWRAFRRFMNVPVAGVEEDAMRSGGDGERPVSEVLDAIERRPEWAVLAAHTPVESAVYQDHAC
jgi:hypothetical protein